LEKIKRIPYGKSDFEAINAQNDYYIDKTMLIPEIEKTPFVFLVRPRRFGKSLFLSTLHSYYDINKGDRFEEFYRETWILENPTEERAKYMIMTFNFSVVSKDKDKVQQNFNDYCVDVINEFFIEYKKYIPERVIKNTNNKSNAHEKLQYLSTGLKENPVKLYIMIDEYDNFTNTLLSEYGIEEYNKITKNEGYFKEFFTVLKAMSTGSGAGLAKMFITGVSPITMDDVTSGMNIGSNISIDANVNEIMGFTEKDVSDIIDYYTSVGVFKLDKAKSMKTMKKWYDGYKFSTRAKNSMYNTDMILYYINKSYESEYAPDNLIDDNTKTDYSKFKHFTTINNKTGLVLNGNFSVLEKIVSDGYINEKLVTSFPYTKYETYELVNLLGDMMYDGDWKEPLLLIAKLIKEGMCARDKIEGERYIQAFFKSNLGLSDPMIVTSEKAALDGYTDLGIAPFLAIYPDIEYAYLIEFKYLKADEKYDEDIKSAIVANATTQLAKYAEDKNIHKEWQIKPYGDVTLIKLILIFKGRELQYMEQI